MLDTELILFMIPIATGLVEVIKKLGIQARLFPVISIVIGIIMAVIAGGTLFQIIFTGLIVGLSASGLYDFAKKTVIGK